MLHTSSTAISIKALAFSFAIFLFGSCQSNGDTSSDKENVSEEMEKVFEQLPEPHGLVNDFEELLEETEEDVLTLSIEKFKEAFGYEITILTVESIEPMEDAVMYATAIGNKWGVGDAERNDGIVILLSAATSQTAIATGKGVEQTFNDAVTKEIIDQVMIPKFMFDEYFEGFEGALNQLSAIAQSKKN